MHIIEKKKKEREIIPVIILVTQFRTRERRKLHFKESNSTNFGGGGEGGWHPLGVPALSVHASATNGARLPAEPLYPVLPNVTENPV